MLVTLTVAAVVASMAMGWFLGYLRSALAVLAVVCLTFAYAAITDNSSPAGPDSGDLSVAEAIVLVDVICGLLAVVSCQVGAFLAEKHKRLRQRRLSGT